MTKVSRRRVLRTTLSLLPASALIRAAETLPLIEPADLASMISKGTAPEIVFVGFPVLYRQKRISRAILAGPASKPEGLTKLKEAVAQLPKSKPLVIYCGCCPMEHCPNIRPALAWLNQSGFQAVRVLDLPTNFHTDWAGKGYPVESSSSSKN